MPRPTITVYAEVSADGKTTHRRGYSSKDMMSFEDDQVRHFRHELRAKSDAIMVGSNTIRIDNPSLTVRDAEGRNPLRVIPSSAGDLPLNSTVFCDGGKTLVAVSDRAPLENAAALERAGAVVVRSGESRVDLARLFTLLYEQGVRSVMVEGGATLLASLFRAKQVDQLIVQHLPVIFGGDGVPSMVGGSAITSVAEAIALRLVEAKTIGGHAVIVYSVVR